MNHPRYPNTSPTQWVDGYPCLPECSPHAKKPRVSGAEFGGTSTLATAHAAPVNNWRLARPSRLRCDNYHKNALFSRVLQQMSACMTGRNARFAARAYQHGECGKWSTLAEQSKRKIKKGAVGAEVSERSDVGRPRCSGGFSSEHFWISGQRLRTARRAPQRKRRAVPVRCTSMVGVDHE